MGRPNFLLRRFLRHSFTFLLRNANVKFTPSLLCSLFASSIHSERFTNHSNVGAKKSTQTFFVQSFSKTLRVMDVRTKNRGRPHHKVRLSAAPVMGRNFLTQGRPGVRVRNVRGKSGPKSLWLCCFFLPDNDIHILTPITRIVATTV